VHFADSPCHGSYYHSLSYADSHPKGDKHGRSGAKLLADLKDDVGIHLYQFCHLTNHTRMMIRR
jgi:hypothetical protein